MGDVTYEPAGEPLDPARSEALIASVSNHTVFTDAQEPREVVPPQPRRAGLSKPAQAVAVGGAGVLTGLLLAALIPGPRQGRLISAPALRRRRRRLRTKQTTSVLVDLHLLER